MILLFLKYGILHKINMINQLYKIIPNFLILFEYDRQNLKICAALEE